MTKIITAYNSTLKTLRITLTGEPCERKPIRLAICIDNSGSMGCEAPIKNQTGSKEQTGMTVLDIVRAAGIAIIQSLNEHDQVSLIKYSDTGSILKGLTNCDKKGKEELVKILTDLEPEGMTNIWDGLLKSLNTLKKSDGEGIDNVFLLTDGQPNVDPPLGYKGELERYKKQRWEKENFPTISTFGFGNNLETKILTMISDFGNGRFVFIPDQSFVGTGMIHALANSLSTVSNTEKISVKLPESLKINQFLGDNFVETENGFDVTDITIKNGQARTFLVRVEEIDPSGFDFTVKVNDESFNCTFDDEDDLVYFIHVLFLFVRREIIAFFR